MSEEVAIENGEQNAPATQPRGWRLANLAWLKNPPIAVAAFAYLVAILFVLAVLVLVAFGLFAAFQIAYETAVGKFTDRIEAAKVFFPILLALVGGPLLIWRVITAHIQAQAMRHQAETGKEALYTSMLAKAVEQLGAVRAIEETSDGVPTKRTEPSLEIRLGAIYTLERIARFSEHDYWSIVELLCAYVRSTQYLTDHETHLKPRLDIQAVIDVLGRRQRRFDDEESTKLDLLDLGSAKLRKASFSDSDFCGFYFTRTNLQSCFFLSTDLRGAAFLWAELDGASFKEANLSGTIFIGVDLRKVEDLTPEQLAGAFADNTTLLPSTIQRPSHWPDRTLGFDEWKPILFKRSRSTHFGRLVDKSSQ